MGRYKEEPPGLLARLLGATDRGVTWVLICGFLCVLFIATYFLWGRFGNRLLSGWDYQITADSIEVSPPQPEWIQSSNVSGESIVSGSLVGMNSRQKDLTVRVGEAYRMHPWVRQVKHCTKRYPAKIHVELEYRKPVAMVEVQGGRLPIDIDGVLLPTVDFTADTANLFPRITAGATVPVSTIAGSAWGDDRVHGGAGVAAFLLPYWNQLKLERIIAYRDPNSSINQSPPYFVLRTTHGTNVIWGHAPHKEISGEPPAQQKLVRLSEFAQQRGGLDVIEPNETIDLRNTGALKVATLPDDIREE